ncbi:hypothetical protein ACHZ98_24380 [Streptomyces sp. MAR4 CNY-716]
MPRSPAQDEELLVQAEYDVRVTDPRWLEQLSVGDARDTASYRMAADPDPLGAALGALSHAAVTWGPAYPELFAEARAQLPA